MEQMTEQFNSEIPVLRNEDIVANYTNRLQGAVDYDGSLQEARDLYQQSVTVTAPTLDDSGIPEDMSDAPLLTPDVQLGEQEEPLMARLFNSAPEGVQKMLTPFLIPFTDNKVLRGVTIGATEGINGVLNLLRDVNNVIVESNGNEGISEEDWLQLPEIIERGDSTTEALVGGLTQFMSVYGALGKFSSVNKLSSRGKKLFDDMWRAGIADAAFDPEEGNLATLINMLDEDKTVAGLPIGQMNGPFTQWLGTPVGEDAEAFERLEQRAKNLLEGAGLGLLANGLIGGLKGLKQIMIESDPDKYFAMLKKAGINADPRTFLMENKQGAENIITPQLNELGMYSQLEKAMLNNRIKTHQPNDLLRYLRKNEVSENEIKNSGVLDLIREKEAAGEKITTDEVMEVFTDMDVTQSYKVITREFQGNDIDGMTDEDELLEIYNAGGNGEVGVNGKVLDHDEVDGDIEYLREDLMSQFDDDIYDGDDAVTLLNNMRELYPEKYPHPEQTDAADAFYEQLKTINDDTEFRQHAEEATRLMAEKQYNSDPIFRWELAEGDFQYTITGRESTGYETKVYRSEAQGGGRLGQSHHHNSGLDVVYSPTEAMAQVRSHNNNFSSGVDYESGATNWHNEITPEGKENLETYKETIVTADSPSGSVFRGGKDHFPEDNKIFHLRTTERNGNTLFIEELQSDWSNDISKKGVKKGQEYNQSARKALQDAAAERDKFLETTDWKFSGHRLMGDEEELVPRNLDTSIDSNTAYQMGADLWGKTPDNIKEQIKAHNKIVNDLKDKVKAEADAMPVPPLPEDKWINVGLRKAIAMAIDAGHTRVEWTTSAQQVDIWNRGPDGNFEKMYKMLYDKKMGGIAKKIANKYNAEFGQHYIDISPEMIAHHKSGKGEKLMAAAPAIPAAQVANDKEDKS